jgi:hypothetical protein
MYAAFMEEIKWRLDEMHRRLKAVKGQEANLNAIFEVEFCFLQMRFVCELIALAALAAHHSYGLKKDLLEEWHADQIFYELERINEHCFPWPVSLTLDDQGNKHLADAPNLALTRTELKEIYGKCGKELHRGMLKHTLQGSAKIYDANELVGWMQAIGRMLALHSILFPDEERAVLVNLFGGPNREVAVIQLAAKGPFSIQRAVPPQRPSPVTGKPSHPRGGR